jgi:uncharacterized protein
MTDPRPPERFQPGGWPAQEPPRSGGYGSPGYGGEPYGDPGDNRPIQPPTLYPGQPWPDNPRQPPYPQPIRVPSALPDGPREYQQMLRGPRRRWWRPLVALPIAVGIALVAQILAIGPMALAGAVAGVDGVGRWMLDQFASLTSGRGIGPGAFLYLNLGLIALIPAAGLSIWAAHHIRPRFVSSVQGGIRWRWLLRCVAILLPLWAVYIGLAALSETPASPRPAQWVLLLVMAVVLTPLQAAGEEFVFRGWILQNVGSWFRRPLLGLIVGTVVSVAAFSAAHGSPDPWILASLAVFATTCCLVTWRTGGLEAGIAIHAVNNVGVFGVVIVRGGWAEAFISGTTKGSAVSFLIDLAVHIVALVLIFWQARRARIQRTYQPPVLALAPGGSTGQPPYPQQPYLQQTYPRQPHPQPPA